jgi:hypothetical protein
LCGDTQDGLAQVDYTLATLPLFPHTIVPHVDRLQFELARYQFDIHFGLEGQVRVVSFLPVQIEAQQMTAFPLALPCASS